MKIKMIYATLMALLGIQMIVQAAEKIIVTIHVNNKIVVITHPPLWRET